MESEILERMHKRLVQGFLDLVILLELEKHPMNGYDLFSFVQNKFHILLSSGMIYSYLYALEKDGLVKSEYNQKKKVYTLTDRGRETVRTLPNLKTKILGLMLNLFVG